MRLPPFALVSALATACATSETRQVRACGTADRPQTAPTEGALTVLPSLLPGVKITKASWHTHVSSGDGVTTEYLTYSAMLHADRRVEQGEIVLLYDAPGAHSVVDNGFVDQGAEQFELGDTAPFLHAGAERTVSRTVQLGTGYRFGRASTLDYCPSSVRVVPRSTLALELAPALRTAKGQAALMQRATRSAESSLVVVMDTVVSDGPGSTLLVGAALNTADTTLTDMVIALISGDAAASQETNSSPSTPSLDTLEYLVGNVPPHAVVPFAGGWLNAGERIIGRAAYRSTDVKERPIAGDAHLHRVSEASREVRVRAARRAQCAASPGTCAH